MSCRPEDYGEGSGGEQRVSEPGEKRRKLIRWIAMAVSTVIFAVNISSYWMEKPQDTPERGWHKMRGNDGRFWEGTPDKSVYADRAGVRCIAYYQYNYDRQGRLARSDLYRPHDYYENTWGLSESEVCEYDEQGRISQRTQQYGGDKTVYEYSEDGVTETRLCPGMPSDVYVYDTAGNLTFCRIAGRYRYAHETAMKYDGRNRKVEEILQIEGEAPRLVMTAEYNDADYTCVETEYDSSGGISRILLNTYDQEWHMTGSVWCALEEVPEGYAPEDCVDYYTRGYWGDYFGGLLLEEMTYGKIWNDSLTNNCYKVFDYDEDGNCTMELSIHNDDSIYMERYVYDRRGRMTEEFHYDCSDVKSWTQTLADGSTLRIDRDEDAFRIERMTGDGSCVNRFVYEDHKVKEQHTPSGIVYWRLSPSQMPRRDSARGFSSLEPVPSNAASCSRPLRIWKIL